MQSLWTLAVKDLRLLVRDRAGFFFTYFFPFLYASFFGTVFGGAGGGRGGIGVAVVDLDQSDSSRGFIERLEKSEELTVVKTDRNAAADRVRRGKSVAFVLIPEDFDERHAQPFRHGMPQLEIGLDPSRKAESGLLQGVLTKYLFQGMIDRFTKRENMLKMVDDSLKGIESAADIDPAWKLPLQVFLPAVRNFFTTAPVDVSDGGTDGNPAGLSGDFFGDLIKTTEVRRASDFPKSSYDISFPQGIIWGLLSCSAGFGIAIVGERTKGTLVRLRMAPITSRHILGGKALACFLTCVVISVLLFIFGRVAFGVRPDSLLLLSAAILCSAVCFVGLMMLISVLGKTEQSAGNVGWGILSIMAMIGGGMVPLMFMPPFIRVVSHASPIKWSIYAMEGAIWRGFSAWEMVTPCVILLAVGAAAFALGARYFTWTEQQ